MIKLNLEIVCKSNLPKMIEAEKNRKGCYVICILLWLKRLCHFSCFIIKVGCVHVQFQMTKVNGEFILQNGDKPRTWHDTVHDLFHRTDSLY